MPSPYSLIGTGDFVLDSFVQHLLSDLTHKLLVYCCTKLERSRVSFGEKPSELKEHVLSVMITVLLSVICYLESGVDVNVQYQHCSGRPPASDATMSMVYLCYEGDLEGVKAA